jgi:hypothetical protein
MNYRPATVVRHAVATLTLCSNEDGNTDMGRGTIREMMAKVKAIWVDAPFEIDVHADSMVVSQPGVRHWFLIDIVEPVVLADRPDA